MIFLNTNSTNRLALTLNELSSIYQSGGTPYYLFEFKNSQTNNVKYFNPIYISSAFRADVFEIIENSIENLSAGTINLAKGYYEYKIYEQETQYNLSLTGITSCVECGKALVDFDPYQPITYTGNTQSNTVYYNN